MDKESEEVLSAVLAQYDGNGKNYVSLQRDLLKESLAESAQLHCEKLKQYVVIMGTISLDMKKY